MKLVVLFVLFMPALVFAECFVLGDLKGYSTREGFDYEISNDGLSSRKFIVELDGQASSVTPNNMDCTQAGKHTVLCVDASDSGEATIETWAVFPEKGKAVYTKSMSGLGPFNGANLFVGNIKGRCD
ncbi:hypothetical protein [uncultured Marinobacter sp.]|uniref:hypothetical protein n=1 Tax=uncultured Marinobacter sp. TaxID=187379 RepID=UPI0025FA9A87|nr:hypothetical protein [uncultured Marinobacter sp.]